MGKLPNMSYIGPPSRVWVPSCDYTENLSGDWRPEAIGRARKRDQMP